MSNARRTWKTMVYDVVEKQPRIFGSPTYWSVRMTFGHNIRQTDSSRQRYGRVYRFFATRACCDFLAPGAMNDSTLNLHSALYSMSRWRTNIRIVLKLLAS